MKGVLIILDGLGDLPSKLLGGKTPLEAAEMPNLDVLVSRGEMGYMYPVKRGFVPESDEAIVSIFGNKQMNSTRGQLEVIGSGLKLTRGDLALRVNFASIDSLENGHILDRRAGRTLTTAEAEELVKTINEKVDLPCEFELQSTVQHRAALVFRGGFSDNISGNDLTYFKGKSFEIKNIDDVKVLDDEENTQYTVNIVNSFLEQVYEILKDHPVNLKRRQRGLLPANFLLVRGAGAEKPKLKKYKKWMSIVYMPLEIGFSNLSGMSVFDFPYPKLKTPDSYENLWGCLKKACKFSIKNIWWNSKKFDYAYIHIKETDVPGHDNKPIEKKEMLEYIDKTLFKFLSKFAVKHGIDVVVTGDHSTPCKLKNHSADSVPVLFYNAEKISVPKPEGVHFCEKQAVRGKLGKIIGGDLLRKVGFVR